MPTLNRIIRRFSELIGTCLPAQGGTGIDTSAAPAGHVLVGTGTGLALDDGSAIPALAAKADDAAVLHAAGDETKSGALTVTGTLTTFGTLVGHTIIATGADGAVVLVRRDNGAPGFGFYSQAGEFSVFNYATNTISLTIGADHAATFAGAATVGGNLSAPVLATGTTTARNIEDRFADYLHSADMGIVGDAAADDTAAIRAWADRAILLGGKGVLDRPSVAYKVTDTITIQPPGGGVQTHVDFQGLAAYPGAIRWAGPNNKPVFKIIGLKASTIKNINVQIPAGAIGVTAFEFENTVAAPSISDVGIENCRVDFGTGATDCNAWRLGHSVDGIGYDISFIEWRGCSVGGVETGGGNRGWSSEHQNVLILDLINCDAQHVDRFVSNVPTAGAASAYGGSSIGTFGCGTSHCLIDHEYTTAGAYLISGGRYEDGGTSFLSVPNAGANPALSITVSGTEIDGYDGKNVFDLRSSVALILDGVAAAPSTTLHGPEMIRLETTTGVPGSVTATGCTLGATDPFHTVISGNWTVRRDNCLLADLSAGATGAVDDLTTGFLHAAGDETKSGALTVTGTLTTFGTLVGHTIIATGADGAVVLTRRDNGSPGFAIYSQAGELNLFNYTTNTVSLTIGTDHAATFAGAIAAPSFAGDGSGLTNLTAASIAAGTAGISITGDAATAGTITGSIAESQVTGLTSALAAKADDAAVLHLAGSETVTGAKTFANYTRIGALGINGDSGSKFNVDDPTDATASVVGRFSSATDGAGAFVQFTNGFAVNLGVGAAADGGFEVWAGRYPGNAGTRIFRVSAAGVISGDGSGLTGIDALAIDHAWNQFTVSGGAATIDWSASDRWYGTLASGVNTFTYTNVPAAGKSRVLLLRLTQPATGAAGTVTWPANSLAPGGTAPALSATNGAVDDVNVSLTPDGKYDTFLAGAGLAAIP